MQTWVGLGIRTFDLEKSYRYVPTLILCISMVVLSGCTTDLAGRLSIKSQSRLGTSLIAGFKSSYYSMDDHNNVTILLIDGPIEQPIQAVTIHMFWHPRAGRTPIDPTATNATIHYTIFSGETHQQVGIYSGAGFIYPLDKPGQEQFSADVWQATLQLADCSEYFQDLLGQAMLGGYLTTTRNDTALASALTHLQRLVSQRMGYPRWVFAN